ncbi:hypothetical protein EEB19_21295 [Gordonia sp. OPL2]|nr:hypothetical protein EEB19_21295 [Gordonia sp. OPL2]
MDRAQVDEGPRRRRVARERRQGPRVHLGDLGQSLVGCDAEVAGEGLRSQRSRAFAPRESMGAWLIGEWHQSDLAVQCRRQRGVDGGIVAVVFGAVRCGHDDRGCSARTGVGAGRLVVAGGELQHSG